MAKNKHSGQIPNIEYDREHDGRWIAEIHEVPGCLVYGATQEEANEKVLDLYIDIMEPQIGEDDEE